MFSQGALVGFHINNRIMFIFSDFYLVNYSIILHFEEEEDLDSLLLLDTQPWCDDDRN